MFDSSIDSSRVKTVTKKIKLDDCPDGLAKIVIDYGLKTIGDQSPYFTVTADLYEPRPSGLYLKEPDAGGCLHQEVLLACPELKPLVDLHLSDIDGVPMYPKANPIYWFKNGGDKTTEILCKYLRATTEEIADIKTVEELDAFIDTLYPRWKEEAEAAIKQFNL